MAAYSRAACLDAATLRVPRIVWMYWEQGWAESGDTCKAAAHGWERLNPGWQLRFLNGSRASLSQYLPLELVEVVERVPVHKFRHHGSDLLRLAVLATHGGVYADCDAFCGEPLDRYIDAATAPGGFYAYRLNTSRPVASWFLASLAPPRNFIAQHWLTAMLAHNGSLPDEYFGVHIVFGRLLRWSRPFASLFLSCAPQVFASHGNCPGECARDPEFFLRYLPSPPPGGWLHSTCPAPMCTGGRTVRDALDARVARVYKSERRHAGNLADVHAYLAHELLP